MRITSDSDRCCEMSLSAIGARRSEITLFYKSRWANAQTLVGLDLLCTTANDRAKVGFAPLRLA